MDIGSITCIAKSVDRRQQQRRIATSLFASVQFPAILCSLDTLYSRSKSLIK